MVHNYRTGNQGMVHNYRTGNQGTAHNYRTGNQDTAHLTEKGATVRRTTMATESRNRIQILSAEPWKRLVRCAWFDTLLTTISERAIVTGRTPSRRVPRLHSGPGEFGHIFRRFNCDVRHFLGTAGKRERVVFRWISVRMY